MPASAAQMCEWFESQANLLESKDRPDEMARWRRGIGRSRSGS